MRINERRREGTSTHRQERDKLVILSINVVALYPSIKRDMAKEAILKAIRKADIHWENVDITKLTRHVALTVERSEIRRLNLEEVVPVPKRKTTFRSYIHPQKT